jgi:hypothetical protein
LEFTLKKIMEWINLWVPLTFLGLIIAAAVYFDLAKK